MSWGTHSLFVWDTWKECIGSLCARFEFDNFIVFLIYFDFLVTWKTNIIVELMN